MSPISASRTSASTGPRWSSWCAASRLLGSSPGTSLRSDHAQHGTRLRREARHVFLVDSGDAPNEPIFRVEHFTLRECLAYFEALRLFIKRVPFHPHPPAPMAIKESTR